MIARMAKITILGPKALRRPVLHLLGRERQVQVRGRPTEGHQEGRPVSTAGERENLATRFRLEDLQGRIGPLLNALPDKPLRPCYLQPQRLIDVMEPLVDGHVRHWQEMESRREDLRFEVEELERAADFLTQLQPLIPTLSPDSHLDCFGVALRDPAGADELRRLLRQSTEGRYELHTRKAKDGGLLGLITFEREDAPAVRKALEPVILPEVPLSTEIRRLPTVQRLEAIQSRRSQVAGELNRLETARQRFLDRWGPLYRGLEEGLQHELELVRVTLELRETDLCFVLTGWVPALELDRLQDRLRAEFEGRVILEEQAIREEELENVPVTLQNPAFVRPFELLTRLVPLPRYGTIDPTPLVALFFPLFFGLILGDMGYGALLVLVAVGLVVWGRSRPVMGDCGRILGICALYTVVFGGLYGEFFGPLGRHLFGLEPVILDRATALIPMLLFALAVGLVHVVVGLILGTVTAVRARRPREAWFRGTSAVMLLIVAGVGGSFFLPWTEKVRPVLLIGLGIGVPVLLLTGGLLAPLELLKSIGNVISYARLMAVGLTSVLLAEVAHELSGLAGSLWVGLLVATALHGFNLLLGVFAPTVHSLRLHYVEFFGKFLEPGGARFKPLDTRPPAKGHAPSERTGEKGDRQWKD